MTADQSDDQKLVVSGDQLADRRARYFMDRQIGLHGTIVSIALGVAGLAAASLFEVRAADRPYHLLMWMLWVISLLGVGVVYSGMTVSVYVLPSVIPDAADTFLPFGLGLTEFMLFALLTTPLTAQLGPRPMVDPDRPVSRCPDRPGVLGGRPDHGRHGVRDRQPAAPGADFGSPAQSPCRRFPRRRGGVVQMV